MNNGEFDPSNDPGGLGELPPDIPDTSLGSLSTLLGNPLFAGAPVGASPPPSAGGMGKPILQLLGLLLAGGGLAGVGQNLFGRPPTTTTTPKLSPQQLGLLSGAQGQFGQSQNILNLLMGGLQSPQISPALSALTEQAFQPRFGDLYSQAVQAGRSRGFYDAPATSPPGGAILGPGLANLQGQMAQAKLNLYQNNISNLLNALQGSQRLGATQGQIATGLPTAQRQQLPQPSILDTLKGATGIARDVGDILRTAGSAGGQGIGSFLSGLNPMNWFS